MDCAGAGGERMIFAAKKKGLTEIELTFTVSIPQLSLLGSWQTALSVKSNHMGPERILQLGMPVKRHGLVDGFNARS
jgi:hypothetical protein